MKSGLLFSAVLSAAFLLPPAAWADIPLLNATCPGGIDVHADQGGPIYINGKEGKLKKVNDNYYEARGGGVTISLAINPDGSPSVSYTGKNRANGICSLAGSSSASSAPAPAPSASGGSKAVSRGNMPAYCRGEVSGQYGTKPMYVKTSKPKHAKDGSTTIRGTVDKGNEGIKAFECQFDAKSRFVGVMALTSDGE